MTFTSLVRLMIGTLALAGATSCGSDSSGPPTAPGAGRTVQALSIDGPSAVAPGESVRFVATVTYTDGTREDLSNAAVWVSQFPDIASVDRAGQVTARGPGTTGLLVRLNSLSAARSVIVVPQGTYRLAGRVLEADSKVPVAGARIEVTAGTGAGLTTESNEIGRYWLHGVSGSIDVRITKAGYEPQVVRLSAADHLDVDTPLPLAEPRPAVAGMYDLQLTLDPSCSDSWPAALRTRRYRASITQSLTHVTVTLSGARFAAGWDGQGGFFEGRVEPPGLTFRISTETSRYYGWYDYADVTEILEGADGWLVAGGDVVAARQSNGFAGTLNGAFVWFPGDPLYQARENASCTGRHGFVLTAVTN